RSSDGDPARAHDAPQTAVLGDVLAEDLARLAIADVVVERPTCVRRLQPSVAPADRADERPAGTDTSARSALDDERRPCGGAGAGAAARAAVGREGVEHEAAVVEEDAAERGAVDDDGRSRDSGRRGCRAGK